MSIDKDDTPPVNGPGKLPERPSVSRTIATKVATWFAIGPIVMLPVLVMAALTWGVIGRIVWELFSFSWDLFGF